MALGFQQAIVSSAGSALVACITALTEPVPQKPNFLIRLHLIQCIKPRHREFFCDIFHTPTLLHFQEHFVHHGKEANIYFTVYIMKTQDTFKFAETHEWASLEEDGLVWVGISNHAQEALGDVMFFQAPKISQIVKQGEAIAAIESVKAASDIHSPISGEIIALNEEMDTTPEIVNQQPYAVWLFKIKPASEKILNAELSALLSLEKYNSGAGA